MNNIKLLRIKKNLSQEQLAKEVHVTQTAVSHWEKGKTNPDMQTADKLALLFGVSVDYLLGRTEEYSNIYTTTNIHGSQFVQGSGKIEMNNESVLHESALSREERELIRIYRILNIRDCHKLLDYAFKLEQKETDI